MDATRLNREYHSIGVEEKMERLCCLRKDRGQPGLGQESPQQITVLKSLIASQLVYILSPLPTNHHALEEINNLFFKFLWSGKDDKIKRTIMINDYSNGGLRMIDIKSFNMALKSTWVEK